MVSKYRKIATSAVTTLNRMSQFVKLLWLAWTFFATFDFALLDMMGEGGGEKNASEGVASRGFRYEDTRGGTIDAQITS